MAATGAGGLDRSRRTADGALVVDHALRTSAADVFAAGDCCAFPYKGRRVRLESWRAAQEQGAQAARAILGAEDAYAAGNMVAIADSC